MVYKGESDSTILYALKLFEFVIRKAGYKTYNNQDGIEWELQPMYLQYQLSGKNGSY